MILAVIDNLPQYFPLNKGFEKAAEFLGRQDLDLLTVGRHEIDGDLVYAMVSKSVGREKNKAKLEAHEQYIDIQVVLGGIDNMGWKSKSLCVKPVGEYNGERDVQFFMDEPDSWLQVRNGMFVIFFPEDAHLPSISSELIHKIIVKVAVDQI